MASDATNERAEQADPANLLLHRMPVRRLEGEIVRDNLLAVSHRLDRKLFGPSVAVHLTPFMEGRGRPSGDGGPLDGDGRRSVYVEVRRNFLSPMMLAFDVPAPASCMGRRTVSNVPSQALIMLNDPLVQELAKHWAKQLLTNRETNESRIRTMYQAALARQPTRDELSEALTFLKTQADVYDIPADKLNGDVKLWTDLCHVIINLKEFIFIQ